MIEFKEQDGLLFKMLDKPVPLTPDAKFPCVVRLIQDDSPMGRYNQSYSEYRYGVKLGCCMLPIIATHIAKNGVVNDIEWDINRYEIIGTFVEEGSADWAWYQMMNGEKVNPAELVPRIFYANKKERFYAIKKGCNYCAFYESDWEEVCTTPISKRRTYDEFIEYSKSWGILSWEIYKEPEPLLADAGIGDIVKTNLGDWLQIVDTPRLRFGHDKCYRTHDGLYWNECGVCDVDSTYRLVAVEPLATEGTKEWAWQQMLLGNEVWNPKLDSHKAKRILGVQKDSHWVVYAEPTGWQIYKEPKQDDIEKPLRSMIAEAKALGKNIRTYYQDIVFTPQALEECLNQGKFRWWNICNWELTTREQNYYPSIFTSNDRSKEEKQSD